MNDLRATVKLHYSSFSRRVFDDRIQIFEARLIEHLNATARLSEITADGGNRAHGAFAKCIVKNVLELQKLAISHRRSQRARVDENPNLTSLLASEAVIWARATTTAMRMLQGDIRTSRRQPSCSPITSS